MALFMKEDHAANPPETWQVRKVAERRWELFVPIYGLETFPTKKAAEAAKVSGFLVNLYEKERRYYAGQDVPGWKPSPYKDDA